MRRAPRSNGNHRVTQDARPLAEGSRDYGTDGKPRSVVTYPDAASVGAWRSLVARLLWEQEAPGSNPGAPTTFPGSSLRQTGASCYRKNAAPCHDSPAGSSQRPARTCSTLVSVLSNTTVPGPTAPSSARSANRSRDTLAMPVPSR